MAYFKKTILTIHLVILITCNSINNYAQFNYISPKPDSYNHNSQTNIILKQRFKIDIQSVNPHFFTITGTLSGNHDFVIKLAENATTIILKPTIIFQKGETVNVSIAEGIRLADLTKLGSFAFSFKISEQSDISQIYQESNKSYANLQFTEGYPNFPPLTVNVSDNPSEGRIFFYNISALASSNDRYMAIINNDGTPFYAKQENNSGLSFTLQKNGYLTHWNKKNFYMLDSSYSVIDSFACGNGYTADWHELQVLKNGHAFLISWDFQIVDMSLIVSGGQKIATVEGLIIQELDEKKDVVFQWRSWDHFDITDAIDVDFTKSSVSYVHGNAIEIDSDSTLLLSSRLMNEITKINRKTGEIIWRLGGKKNEFTFIDDNQGFCRQHDIRSLNNGHITLFDNGSCHAPKTSSAKEYELDELNKTAKLVWKYEYSAGMYCETMGNVQRLPNGNTFINWGRIPDSGMTGPVFLPAITEVRPDNTIAYQLTFNTFFHLVYRSYRFPWDIGSPNKISNPFVNNSAQFNSIFPNPANDFFNINIFLNSPDVLNISIINASGIPINKITNYNAKEGSNTILIETKDYNSGIYLCVVSSVKTNFSKKVFISK